MLARELVAAPEAAWPLEHVVVVQAYLDGTHVERDFAVVAQFELVSKFHVSPLYRQGALGAHLVLIGRGG